MEILEAKRLALKLGADIKDLILQYEVETGLDVTNIRLNRVHEVGSYHSKLIDVFPYIDLYHIP